MVSAEVITLVGAIILLILQLILLLVQPDTAKSVSEGVASGMKPYMDDLRNAIDVSQQQYAGSSEALRAALVGLARDMRTMAKEESGSG